MSSSTPPPPADEANQQFRARRGSQWLSNDEFQAYLAAAIRLEHINLLLGAGCSFCLGGQTMRGVWDNFQEHYSASHHWLSEHGFIADPCTPNVEELLNSLAIAEAEWRRADDWRLPDLRVAVADLHRAVINGSLLNRSWWEEPETVRAAPELQDHRTMLLRLCGARQAGQDAPWLFTTNYDLGIEWTAESLGLRLVNGFTGLHVRTFAPQNFDVGFRSTAARGEAQYLTSYFYLAKLHGSLSWQQRQGSVRESPASELWPVVEEFLNGERNEGPGMVVYPQALKYQATGGFLLGELFRRLTDAVSKPQTCLITCGYSFSDEHLNRIILTALQNPTLQLIAYVPAAKVEDGELDTSNCQETIQALASLQAPQVTLVPASKAAYFDRFVQDLPDPMIYDEHAQQIQRYLNSALPANEPEA